MTYKIVPQRKDNWSITHQKDDSILKEAALDCLNRMCFNYDLLPVNIKLLSLCLTKRRENSSDLPGLFSSAKEPSDIKALDIILEYNKHKPGKRTALQETRFKEICEFLTIQSIYPAEDPSNSFRVMQDLGLLDIQAKKLDAAIKKDPLISIKEEIKEMLTFLSKDNDVYNSHIDATASVSARDTLRCVKDLLDNKFDASANKDANDFKALTQLLRESFNKPEFLYLNGIGFRLNILKIAFLIDEIEEYWIKNLE